MNQTSVERIVAHVFDGVPRDALSDELSAWMVESRRFRTFVEAHRDKARKKLRTAADAEARADVRAELAVAHGLLADRRIELGFEAHGSTKGGPDFTVRFRATTQLNLEVTRIRGEPTLAAIGATVLAKLRQLPPGMPNILLIATTRALGDAAIGDAVRGLRDRADRRDDAFFVARGIPSSRTFYDRFLRLGAVIVWAEPEGRATPWLNRSARIEVPGRAASAIEAALTAGRATSRS